MKTLILISFVTICPLSLMQSQSRLAWEFSLSGSMGSASEKVEQDGGIPALTAAGKFFSLAFRPGFLISGPVEFEPEISVTGQTGQLPTYALSANLTYNVILSRGGGVILFPLVGYGSARGNPTQLRSFAERPKLSLVNLGLGIKVLMTRNVGLRLEGRFQQYTGKLPGTSARYTNSTGNLFFGFSFFF